MYTEIYNEIFAKIQEAIDDIKKRLMEMDEPFLDTQNVDYKRDSLQGYAFNEETERTEEMNLAALSVIDGRLVAYLTPITSSHDIVYDKDFMISDINGWYDMEKASLCATDITIVNILYLLDQYFEQ